MLKTDHLGIVVKDIKKYIASSPYPLKGQIVFDPIQNSNLCTLLTPEGEISIELIEPIDETATTYSFLQKNGNSIHHICYVVSSEEQMLDYIKEFKLKLILGPVNAVLFNNRKVAFAYSRVNGIVEFLIIND